MDLGLKGKVALVTGAGSQIGYGKGIVLALAGEGCDIVAADIDLAGAEKTAAEVEASGCRALAVRVDVTNRAEVADMVRAALDRFGRIDILVNNAGNSRGVKPFMEMSDEEVEFDINVNLYGQINVMRAVLPHMVSRHYGRIINTSGGIGVPNISIYGAAKSGIEAFTRSLAAEVAPLGIVVNGIQPGFGRTGFVSRTAPREFFERTEQRSTLKRLCTPEDVGPVVAFLASDVCSYMLGHFIRLGGP